MYTESSKMEDVIFWLNQMGITGLDRIKVIKEVELPKTYLQAELAVFNAYTRVLNNENMEWV